MIQNLAAEITKALEIGLNRHLDRSFFYRPFKIYLNLFKKKNPNTIRQIRDYVAEDIEHMMDATPGFYLQHFLRGGSLTHEGRQLLQTSCNITYHLLKKKITVKIAFQAMREDEVRSEIYAYILTRVQNRIVELLPKEIEDDSNH